MEKILVVSHCILNKASKVKGYNMEEMEEENQLRKELLKEVFDKDIELLQLPCPEFIMYGSKRWGHVKNQFDNPFFRKNCKEILNPIIEQLKEYNNSKDRFQILGIVSVEGSPSCGYNLTCKGNYGGELGGCSNLQEKIESIVMVNEAGVFMEELEMLLNKNDLHIDIRTMQDQVTYLKKL
ncbi:CD3072 family TudS-related putative desulfidase [Terrisporobacter sp.]|uniref:CD3072 family TudS-related putative desulfidase n=1 Tax=Terrisporobacter sp. TaxID=1965305 RepID=UPI00261AAF53|nr:CD3072 family TudS-related putative desulfidase [Terrisporobacter sp.]